MENNDFINRNYINNSINNKLKELNNENNLLKTDINQNITFFKKF